MRQPLKCKNTSYKSAYSWKIYTRIIIYKDQNYIPLLSFVRGDQNLYQYLHRVQRAVLNTSWSLPQHAKLWKISDLLISMGRNITTMLSRLPRSSIVNSERSLVRVTWGRERSIACELPSTYSGIILVKMMRGRELSVGYKLRARVNKRNAVQAVSKSLRCHKDHVRLKRFHPSS